MEAIRRAFGGLGRAIKAVAEKLRFADVIAWLRSCTPMVALGLPEVANKITAGLTGIK